MSPLWQRRKLLRLGLAMPLMAAAAGAIGGCQDGDITQTRIQSSVATTFGNLWVLQQSELGHPHPGSHRIDAAATCTRSTPGAPAVGAADDWVCEVTFTPAVGFSVAEAVYDLDVMTDGCYSADGSGPAAINGSATLNSPSVGVTVNPLWKFHSCFDTD